jgi:hypothetical protein
LGPFANAVIADIAATAQSGFSLILQPTRENVPERPRSGTGFEAAVV